MYICPIVESLLEDNNYNKFIVNFTTSYLIMKVIYVMLMVNPFDNDKKLAQDYRLHLNSEVIYFCAIEILNLTLCLYLTLMIYKVIKQRINYEITDSVVFLIIFNLIFIVNKLFLESLSHKYKPPISNFLQIDFKNYNNMGLFFDVILVNILILLSLKLNQSKKLIKIKTLTLFVVLYQIILNTDNQINL